MTETIGSQVDIVWVEIDYAILQHFSKHLYSSPHKAVEELVTNGYDALATSVRVFLPGAATVDHLVVWDNGTSMDQDGLKHLWWIARSPKDDGQSREATSSDGAIRRKMVGKFGIGKLASYAVGDSVSHLCRRGSEYLLVRVDYRDAPRLDDSDAESTKGFPAPLMRLTAEEAKLHVERLFDSPPHDLEEMLKEDYWTFAVVGDLREGISLSPGRLRWVLGNGMPLRPDFQVSVNGEAVAPAVLSGEVVHWDAHSDELRPTLTSEWADARDHGDVDGDPRLSSIYPEIPGWEGRVVWLPNLGPTRISMRLFNESLRKGRPGEHGRSEGFFVYVRGRLVNPDDPKLLLADPSYGTFNRMHIVIHADGLDDALLADRERVARDTALSAELAALQSAIYLAARAKLEALDEHSASTRSVNSLLPTDSREFFIGPLVALAQRSARESDVSLSPVMATLTREARGADTALIDYDADSNSLRINESHPLFLAAREKLGAGKVAKEALRLIELLAISDATYAGHLLDVGIDEDSVESLIAWREAQLRNLAQRYGSSGEEILAELHDASFVGGRRFEKAIAAVFRHMGFVASREGASGKHDVLVVAPVGTGHEQFTVEAKGKRSETAGLENDKAEISGAAAHAKAVGASFSIVVARDFAGFMKGDEAAILAECRCQQPPVSILTVEALIALSDAMSNNHYPLSIISEVLKPVESPTQKLERIAEVRNPLSGVSLREVLDAIWAIQQGVQSEMAVPLNQVKAMRQDWKKLGKDKWDRIFYGLEAVTGGLVEVVESEYGVQLLNDPSHIMDLVYENEDAADPKETE